MSTQHLRQLREIRDALHGRLVVDRLSIEQLRCLDFDTLLWMDRLLDAVGGDLERVSTSDRAVFDALVSTAQALHAYREAGGAAPSD